MRSPTQEIWVLLLPFKDTSFKLNVLFMVMPSPTPLHPVPHSLFHHLHSLLPSTSLSLFFPPWHHLLLPSLHQPMPLSLFFTALLANCFCFAFWLGNNLFPPLGAQAPFTERLWVLLVAVSLVDFGSVVAAGLDVERAVLLAGWGGVVPEVPLNVEVKLTCSNSTSALPL